MKTVKIGLLGLGTVGSGVYKLLTERGLFLEERLGTRFEIKKILVRDSKKVRKVAVPASLLTTNPEEVLADEEISIVVELIGGVEPAHAYVVKALKSGKKVVTANKSLLAQKGDEVFRLAREKKIPLGFEASVAGGIPILKAIQEGFVGNRIQEIYGIINGTSNYVLSEMTEKGEAFDRILARAQKEGYAESDPQIDINGHDAAQKLSILISLCTGNAPSLDKIAVEGIQNITPFDIEAARKLGFKIKLLAIFKEKEGRVEARVHPTFIPLSHPLADVGGIFNAIVLKGDAVGETMFYGRG
ncbi:MAG: homoserine dehydrogenase, partial [Deltaproteobacteria bacterium]|nr:homoserine dehydrogenase [Deltaproteobacteria bacterium]